MPNRNYEKGRRKEYKICNDFRERGFEIVQRSAGSHSPIDVFAINKKTKEIVFIQSKPDNYVKAKCEKILQEQKDLNSSFKVRFILL